MFWFLLSLFLLVLLLQYDGVMDDIIEAQNGRKKTWAYKLMSLASLTGGKIARANKARKEKKEQS